MNAVSVSEIVARSALNHSRSPHAEWTLNPYRGCAHACAYCYARRTHEWLELGLGEDFERRLFAKTNLPSVLANELARLSPKNRLRSVVIGTASDPYQPAEGVHRITRGCLSALARAGIGCTILTKGTLVVRDIDILTEMSTRAPVNVLFSLSSVDSSLAKVLEPGAPSPDSRLRALAMLRAAGVRAGVLLCPVVPGVTDDEEHLRAVFAAARDAGAADVDAGALRLAPTVREHFLAFLSRYRPDLTQRYRLIYRFGTDADREYRDALARAVATARAEVGFAAMPRRPVTEPPIPEQLCLFD